MYRQDSKQEALVEETGQVALGVQEREVRRHVAAISVMSRDRNMQVNLESGKMHSFLDQPPGQA